MNPRTMVKFVHTNTGVLEWEETWEGVQRTALTLPRLCVNGYR